MDSVEHSVTNNWLKKQKVPSDSNDIHPANYG